MAMVARIDMDIHQSTGNFFSALDVPTVCGSLREALESLDADREYLKKGDVMDDDMIDGYLGLKWEEVYNFEHTPHPVEFKMYYSC